MESDDKRIEDKRFTVQTVLLIFTLIVTSIPAWAQDGLNLGPLPTQIHELESAEKQDDQQIQILERQLSLYSDYLASKGQSVEIKFQRNLSSVPETVLVLGASSGVLSSGLGLIGFIAQDSSLVSKRFFWTGAIITIATAVASHFLRIHYANTPDEVAREKMVEELDANPNAQIRQSMEVLMAKQLFDLQQRNRQIRFALERDTGDTKFSTNSNSKSGIIPRYINLASNENPTGEPWNHRYTWNDF